ncbi:MAG: tetratricopeptide repeat protein, partial [Myxococcales bacterium]|nr:tetratricopeptide repeat protein [Myxococcales bacterium]
MLPDGELARATIVDFGVARLARALAPSPASVTLTGDHVGTPRYMAPEQIRSARGADRKADVFALGCILFECLTGRPAFGGHDPVTVLARILFEPLPVPSAARPGVPGVLDALVAEMMDRDVERRLDPRRVEERVAEVRAGLDANSLDRAGRPAMREDFDAGVLEDTPWPGGAARSPGGEGASRVAMEDTLPLPPPHDAPPPPSFQLGPNALATAARRVLPPQSWPLVGREDECRHLAGLLSAGAPMVVVWGGPGIGKSRLAVEAVQRLAVSPAPPWDALVYADLTEARDADDVVRVVATEAGVSLEPTATPEVGLGRALDKLGRVLLVVDPIEHLAVVLSTLVRAFTREAPGLRVLATSRRRWTPAGAVAVEIGPLATIAPPGRPSAAASLLLSRAARAGSGLAPPEGDAPDPSLVARAERLAAALDGIPLALELAAASVPILGFDGVLARVTGAPESGAAPLDAVHGPMRRVLEGSWNLLGEAEREAFAQCAVFRGGFTAEAAESVLAVPGGRASVVDVLQSLRDHSLLQSLAVDAGAVRISMFSPVREFAWEKLQAGGGAAAALRRHAAHFAELRGGGASSTWEVAPRVQREAENLFAAAEFSLFDDEGDPADGLRVLVALEPAFAARPGAALGYMELLDRGLAREAALAGDPALRPLAMQIRQIRARLDATAGRAGRARADLQTCLDDAVARGDLHREGLVLLDLAVVHHLERSWAEARRAYEAALERLRAREDPSAQGRCLGNLGALAHDEGDFGAAARMYRRAIALLESAGEVRHRANLIGNLAVLEQELGHLDEARRHYATAIALLEPLRDARVLAINLGNSGVLELELGFPERAVEQHERSLGLLAGSGDARSRALCLSRLAAALALRGRLAEAEARLDQAEAVAEDAVSAELAALARGFVDLTLAEGALAHGDRPGAQAHLAAARARVTRAAEARDGEHAMCERSDDLRSMLRILLARLDRVGSGQA